MLVSPNHPAHPTLAIRTGERCVATRDTEGRLERIRYGETVRLALGTRLRHVRTDYSAECIPPIEYADVVFEIETGEHAGRLVVFLTVEMDAPVPERLRLAEQGVVSADGEPDPSGTPAD